MFSDAKSISSRKASASRSDGSVYVTSDQTSITHSNQIVDQAELTPKSSTGNIYLSAQNLGSGKVCRSQTPPAKGRAFQKFEKL